MVNKHNCVVCGAENVFESYQTNYCKRCGQKYDYCESLEIKLTREQKKALREHWQRQKGGKVV